MDSVRVPDPIGAFSCLCRLPWSFKELLGSRTPGYPTTPQFALQNQDVYMDKHKEDQVKNKNNYLKPQLTQTPLIFRVILGMASTSAPNASTATEPLILLLSGSSFSIILNTQHPWWMVIQQFLKIPDTVGE